VSGLGGPGVVPRVDTAGHQEDDRRSSNTVQRVALSELRLNSSLVRYLQRYDDSKASAITPSASEPTQQYQPWSLDRRFSETDIKTIIDDFLSGTPKHELARRYSVSLSGIKNLLRRRGIRRGGRRNTPH
jgi:hypothetical protein